MDGHSTVVADKHYWRVTDADYECAIQKAQQQASQNIGMDRQRPEKKSERSENVSILGLPVVFSVLPDEQFVADLELAAAFASIL